MDIPHETNVYQCINGIVSVPKGEVLKGSYCGGLIIRYNRQKMRVDGATCQQRYLSLATSNNAKPKINKLFLEKPIWNGGEMLVGIATKRFAKGDVRVFSKYRNKSGRPLWDGGLYCTKEFAKQFPVKHYNNTAKPLTVYMIPLDDLLAFNESYKDMSRPVNYVDFDWTPNEL